MILSYRNCAAAYADGVANIPAGSPQYAKRLDRDGDGVACDKPPHGFTLRPATTHAATQHAPASAPPHLPQTGPGEVTAVGGLLLALGAAAVTVARRRRHAFHA